MKTLVANILINIIQEKKQNIKNIIIKIILQQKLNQAKIY